MTTELAIKLLDGELQRYQKYISQLAGTNTAFHFWLGAEYAMEIAIQILKEGSAVDPNDDSEKALEL